LKFGKIKEPTNPNIEVRNDINTTYIFVTTAYIILCNYWNTINVYMEKETWKQNVFTIGLIVVEIKKSSTDIGDNS